MRDKNYNKLPVDEGNRDGVECEYDSVLDRYMLLATTCLGYMQTIVFW